MQQLFQKINAREINLDIVVKKINTVAHGHQELRKEYNTEIKEDLRIFLDLSIERSQELITAIVCSEYFFFLNFTIVQR